MHLKINTVKDKKTNKVRRYLRLEETYREGGKVKKRVLANLGNLDLVPKEQLMRLSRRLASLAGTDIYYEDDLNAREALIFGPIVILRKIWEETGLGKIIGKICGKDVSERAFVLICCRLLDPQSEHGLSYFLKEYYVYDDKGRRWEPEFDENFLKRLEESNGKDRVKVKWGKLQKWYRTLDKLIKNKEKIELEIYKEVRNLFSTKVNIVFYDITSTYFEGKGPKKLADFGYSRDGKSDKRQVLLGVVMLDGLPIAHHVFKGRVPDKKTLDSVVLDLNRRFKMKDVIFVADRGINTEENVKRLEVSGYKYILGVGLRNSKRAKEIIDSVNNLEWKEYDSDTRYSVLEMREGESVERWILVYSKERKEYEGVMRKAWMEKGAEELYRLKERVRKGNLKDEKKIAYYLGKISKEYHVRRYFSWEIKRGEFRFYVDQDKLLWEEKCEGKYLLRTNDEKLGERDVIREYKNLWEIESCFREIKDVIKVRPIFHKTKDRVRAHIFVAVLAYFLGKVLQRRIRRSGIRITVWDALEFAKEVKIVELEVGKKVVKLLTQKMGKITKEVFNLMGIGLPRCITEIKMEELVHGKYVQNEIFN